MAEATLALVLFSDTSRIDGGTLRRGATISVRLLGVGLPLTIVLGSLLAGVPHVHPHQDERFEVLGGDAAFDIDGARHVLRAGETIDVPRGTKHTFANAGADEMRVGFEFAPR